MRRVYVLREVLGRVDFIYILTFGRYHSEELYNYFLVRKSTWMITLMLWLGRCFFWLRFNKISDLIRDYLALHKPDLVISVVPMVNGAAIKAVEQLGVPLWVIPTDLDAELYIHQVHEPTYKKFFSTLRTITYPYSKRLHQH